MQILLRAKLKFEHSECAWHALHRWLWCRLPAHCARIKEFAMLESCLSACSIFHKPSNNKLSNTSAIIALEKSYRLTYTVPYLAWLLFVFMRQSLLWWFFLFFSGFCKSCAFSAVSRVKCFITSFSKCHSGKDDLTEPSLFIISYGQVGGRPSCTSMYIVQQQQGTVTSHSTCHFPRGADVGVITGKLRHVTVKGGGTGGIPTALPLCPVHKY